MARYCRTSHVVYFAADAGGDHSVLQSAFQLHSVLVSLVVDAGENQHIQNEQRTADGDGDAECRRISAEVVVSRSAGEIVGTLRVVQFRLAVWLARLDRIGGGVDQEAGVDG